MKAIKIMSSALAAAMLLTGVHTSAFAEDRSQPAMRDITTLELVKDMGIGINLGNTFESCPNWYEEDWIAKWSEGKPNNYETAWGSPVITKEMIEGIAKEGFGVLRIPVAWSNMMAHDGTYTINPEYDRRIHEVVDWTLESGMYAIINIHWDGGWVNNFPDDKDESMKRYTHMWEQIADSFKDYDDYLVFESQNEELGWDKIWNPWGSTDGKAESYALCNEINQEFVDTVRSSGGNNAERHLLISGYNTSIERTCDPLFKMPNDPANRMAISVHYYSPAGFAILEEDADWGKAVSTWGSDADYQSLRNDMSMMKTNFTDKGIPVIVGEYGCPTKNKEPESVRRFLSSVCEEAYKCGHCPVMWSTPGGHYDRDTCKMADQELQKALYNIGGKPFSPRSLNNTPEVVSGDVNNDGAFTVSDAVLVNEWLLGANDVQLENWKAADLCADDKLDIFDLCLLRQELVKIVK